MIGVSRLHFPKTRKSARWSHEEQEGCLTPKVGGRQSSPPTDWALDAVVLRSKVFMDCFWAHGQSIPEWESPTSGRLLDTPIPCTQREIGPLELGKQ